MAVSKELLARYKEMKAKGINITLTELKKQMEEEEKSAANSPETSTFSTDSSPIYSSAPSASEYLSDSSSSYNSYESSPSVVQQTYSAPVEQSTPEISWTTTYSNNNYSEPVEQPSQTSYEGQTGQSSYGVEGASNSWGSQTSYSSTSYSQEPVQNVQPPVEQASPETYSSHSFSNSFDVSVNSSLFKPQVEKVLTSSSVSQTVAQTPDAVNAPTRKYALIGYPLGHSLSSYIHEAGFKSLGLKASYEILETPPETLVDRIKFFKTHGYLGFNVTIPLKLPITMFLDSIDASADIVNAVNTVVIDSQTREMKGYNTDVIGFRNAIPDDVTLCGKVAGVLGTGGAARAAITALAQSQMKEIKLFTRNVPNSLELVNYLRKTFPNVEFNTYQIERIRDLSDIDLLVNTTPIGMLGRGADYTPVEENELRTLKQGAVVYDVIYNPKKTILLKLAQKHGYRTINGVDMFIHQALAAEQIWTGRTPDFKDMKIAALENL